MKHILFIIVFFLNLLKTFAFDYYSDCSDISLESLEWLPNNKFSITLHGPQQYCWTNDEGEDATCFQQGIQIINHYKFLDAEGNDEIFTVWDERRWVNGYTENNFSGARYGKNKDCECSALYEGDVDYSREDSYDPKNFPSPGSNVYLTLTVYAHCYYDGSTFCQGCQLSQTFQYDPQASLH